MNKNYIFIVSTLIIALALSGCAATSKGEPARESVTIMVAAAASLEYPFAEKLIPMFMEKYPHIVIKGTYDSSGKLQTQIEEGLPADIFMSASTKNMDALKDNGLVDADSVAGLLESRIVLIVPASSTAAISTFSDITKASSVALGDPESVPAGQYAKEALEYLGIYDEVAVKTSFGTNVTEALNWVASGSADAGIVYATDAAATDKVKVVAEAPEGSLTQKIIYPAGIVSSSENKDAAGLFIDFLGSDEALAVFESCGFTPVKNSP